MKFKLSLKGIAVGAALAVLISVVATSAPVAAEDVLTEIQQRGKLRVGMATFVPWAMHDQGGNLIGFEIDVAKKIASDMSVEIEFVPAAWSSIIPALLAKKFDVIISGMSITPQRNLTVNFTIPYAHSGQQMASSIELAGGFTSMDDYNDSSVTIACRRGVTSCDFAGKRFPKATLRRFDADALAFQGIVNGEAHAAISSAPTPRFWADEHSDKVFLANDGKNLSRSDEAFALRKDDPNAINFFSNWILVNTSNRWLEERYVYWFENQSAWKDIVAAEQ